MSPRHAKPFWDRVEKTDGCWLWRGGQTDGYGSVRFAGRSQKAHRVAWLLTHRAIPAGLNVLHRCDNPICVNPAHLFLGTIADNNADRHAKGRSRGLFSSGPDHPATRRSGERHWRAKLSATDVAEIRRLRSVGLSTADLGSRYGVHPSTISRIARNVWRQEVLV